VVDAEPLDLCRGGANRRRLVVVAALELEVDPTGEALVEEARRHGPLEIEQVEVGEVCDSHGR